MSKRTLHKTVGDEKVPPLVTQLCQHNNLEITV